MSEQRTDSGWRIERTINVGEIVMAVSVVGTLIVGWTQVQMRQDALEHRTAKLESDVGDVSKAQVAMLAKLSAVDATVSSVAEFIKGPLRDELKEARQAAERSYRHALGERDTVERLPPRR